MIENKTNVYSYSNYFGAKVKEWGAKKRTLMCLSLKGLDLFHLHSVPFNFCCVMVLLLVISSSYRRVWIWAQLHKKKSRCLLHCDADLSKRSLLAWIRDCFLGIVYLHIYCINPEWNGKLQKFVIKQITHTNVCMHTYARLGMGPACIRLAHRHTCMYIIYTFSVFS